MINLHIDPAVFMAMPLEQREKFLLELKETNADIDRSLEKVYIRAYKDGVEYQQYAYSYKASIIISVLCLVISSSLLIYSLWSK